MKVSVERYDEVRLNILERTSYYAPVFHRYIFDSSAEHGQRPCCSNLWHIPGTRYFALYENNLTYIIVGAHLRQPYTKHPNARHKIKFAVHM